MHRPAEKAQGQLVGAPGHQLQMWAGRRGEQGQEVLGLKDVFLQGGKDVFLCSRLYRISPALRGPCLQDVLKSFHHCLLSAKSP